MRKKHLLGLSYIIVFPVIYLMPYLAESFGFANFPRWTFVTNGIASFVGAGVLSLILTPINNRVLEWRKANGRDIEEEERYETADGMIKLTPNDDDR